MMFLVPLLVVDGRFVNALFAATSDSSKITCSKILLVEGKDELSFFEELHKYLNLKAGIDVQAKEVGGKDKFRVELPAFLNDPNIYQVTGYAIIRDADQSAKSALESIQKLLKNNNQPYPNNSGEFAGSDNFKVGIFIMPGNARRGMLEDLCLQSVKDHPLMPHVEEYMTHVKDKMQDNYPKNESKAKLQTFLAGMYETVSNVGLAARKGYWKFDHEAFSFLCNFLKMLAS
jgi:hypothetical protein